MKENKLHNRLAVCRDVRNDAAKSCYHTLKQIIQKRENISESVFCAKWMVELNNLDKTVKSSGWYDPPPLGMAVIFANENNIDRINYPSLRPEKYWTRKDVHFDSKGLGYLFASSYSFIDNVPIIGDFGFTYYLGKTDKIKDHYKKSYEVLSKLIENIKLDMAFKELYSISQELIEKNDLKNYIFGITDKAIFNLGHTIPFIDRDPNSNEQIVINSANSEKIHDIINHARIFSNKQEDFQITDNCAFTFEPRLVSTKKSSLPMFSFHTIIQFVNGKKIILSNMEEILDLLNMGWIVN